MSFEDILRRLREVVGRLEAGELPLEDALAAFEEGVRLTRRGTAILDAAEKRVELLAGGSRVEPFPEASSHESAPPTPFTGEPRR